MPFFAHAFPFGGSVGIIRPCYNNAIYVALGPPRGGPYIWTPATRTYQFGAPSHIGQWLLGLASAPYYCVVSIFPVIVWPGTHIDMMGSSGRAAPSPSLYQQGSVWKYQQFNSGAEYDAEVARLRSQASSCANMTQAQCSALLSQADEIASERIQRFGAPTGGVINCVEGVNCVIN